MPARFCTFTFEAIFTRETEETMTTYEEHLQLHYGAWDEHDAGDCEHCACPIEVGHFVKVRIAGMPDEIVQICGRPMTSQDHGRMVNIWWENGKEIPGKQGLAEEVWFYPLTDEEAAKVVARWHDPSLQCYTTANFPQEHIDALVALTGSIRLSPFQSV